MAGFIFGGDTGMTYEGLQRRRKITDALLQQKGQPRNVAEGLGSAAESVVGAILNNKLDKKEDKLRDDYNSKWSSIVGGLMGGSGGYSGGGYSAPAASSPPPSEDQSIADDAMAAIGKAPIREAGDAPIDFGAVEGQYNLPTGYLARTAQIESNMGKNMDNPNSSAGGPFQFIDSTAKQYGLQNKYDWVQSTDAAARLASDNAAVLSRALGRQPTAAELYLAHQQGAGGAAKMLSNPNARAVDVVGAEAVRLNGGDANMTAGQFAGKWLNKFGDVGGGQPAPQQGNSFAPGPGTQVAQAGGGTANIAQLMQLANDPLANPAQKAVVEAMLQRQMQQGDPAHQLDMEYKRAQIAKMQNPDRKTDYIEGIGLVDTNTGEVIQQYDVAESVDLPSGAEELKWRAEQAGLKEGTPEYRNFVLNGGGDPSNFRALDMQAQASGLEPGSPQYQEFMATRGAGLQAGAKTTATNVANIETGGEAERVKSAGAAQGKADVEGNTALAEMERNLPGLMEVAEQLEALADKATYTLGGQVYNSVRKQAGLSPTEGAQARSEYIAVVDNQVLPFLRQTFGAAFTAKEGDTLRATLGDPDKSPEEKKAVLNAFIEQKKRDVQARGGQVPEEPSAVTFESFSADPDAKRAAEQYDVTLEEMWAIKQGNKR